MWSIRIGHEASLYDVNWFVTLDYAPESLPASLSLEYRDFQLFMKRLRKRKRAGVRYFVAGEYGARYKRPHWHAILFNVDFEDKVKFRNGTWRSEELETLWRNGRAVMGSVTPRSAAYVAGYTQGKVYGRRGAEWYEDVVNVATGEVSRRRPEFCVPSKGIGRGWYEKYKGDLFPQDHAVVEGKQYKVPRYYLERFRKEAEPEVFEELLERRYQRAAAMPVEESSVERRSVRREIAERREKLFSERNLE